MNDQPGVIVRSPFLLEPNEPAAAEIIPTVSAFVQHYALCRELEPSSLYQFEAAAKSFEFWVGRQVPVSELNHELVNRWLVFLAQSGLAPSTVKGRRTHLLALWRLAHNEGLTYSYPLNIRVIKIPLKAPEGWTFDQVCKLLSIAQGLAGQYPKAEPIPSADVGGVHPDRLGHGATWLRLIPYPAAIKKTKGAMVCPWPYALEYFRTEFKAIVAAAGLSGSFKKMRRASASNIERHNPGAGSGHLGHAPGSAIAQRHYLDPRIEPPAQLAWTAWSRLHGCGRRFFARLFYERESNASKKSRAK